MQFIVLNVKLCATTQCTLNSVQKRTEEEWKKNAPQQWTRRLCAHHTIHRQCNKMIANKFCCVANKSQFVVYIPTHAHAIAPEEQQASKQAKQSMRWNQLSWLLPGNYAYWIMIIIIACIIGLVVEFIGTFESATMFLCVYASVLYTNLDAVEYSSHHSIISLLLIFHHQMFVSMANCVCCARECLYLSVDG